MQDRTRIEKPQSTRRWRRLLPWVAAAYWILLFVATHLPPRQADLPGVSDKWLHLAAYAGLAGLWGLSYAAGKPLTVPAAGLLLLLAAMYGVFDELTQPLVGRECDVYDWLADIFGAVVGLAAAVGAMRLLHGTRSDSAA